MRLLRLRPTFSCGVHLRRQETHQALPHCRLKFEFRRTCVFQISTSPKSGCRIVTLPAALLTKKSPAITASGKPDSEYGNAWAEMMGNLVKIAKPEPKAPLRKRR